MTMVREQRAVASLKSAFAWGVEAPCVAWRDRSGRFCWLRLISFLLVLAPLLWLAIAFGLDALGVRPIETALDVTGVWAIRFLIFSLAVTPLREVFGWRQLIRVRRMLGLAAAAYAGLHLTLYVAQQNFDLLRAASEIALRTYLSVGFLALAGLMALALTSTDRAIRRLGPRWRLLHKAVYPLTALALLHFMMQAKLDLSQALFYVGVFLLLMFWRLLSRARVRPSPLVLALSALAAVPLVMALEIGWRAATSSASLQAVFERNFYFGALSPAWQVGLLGGGVALTLWLARLYARRRAGA